MFSQGRRTALLSLAGLSALALVGGCTGTMAGRGAPRKLGIQLYMLGDDVGANLDGTLKQLAEIGYREVELPHFYERDPAVLAGAISRAGLSCPSIQVPMEPLWPNMPTLQNLDVIVAAAKTLGASNVVVTLFPTPARLARSPRPGESPSAMIAESARTMTVAEWQDIARRLDEVGDQLARQGLRLSYHNHNVEFNTLPDGRTVLDFLMAQTDPTRLGLELDVGWAASAGLDPVALVDRYGRRIGQVHMKDVAAAPPAFDLVMTPADLGKGAIDWKRLVPALDRAGVEHFYVEQEPPFVGTRMEAARDAFLFLNATLNR